MRTVVYDSGALIAADRSDRRFWAEHRARLERGLATLVPTPVLAQVSRSPRQAQLRRLIAGCQVVPLAEGTAHRAGALLAKSRSGDVVDAAVVALAVERRADIVTSDLDDLQSLVDASGAKVHVARV